jgi:hypothetical protein
MPEIIADMVVGADESLIHGDTNGLFDSGVAQQRSSRHVEQKLPGTTVSWPLTAPQLASP